MANDIATFDGKINLGNRLEPTVWRCEVDQTPDSDHHVVENKEPKGTFETLVLSAIFREETSDVSTEKLFGANHLSFTYQFYN